MRELSLVTVTFGYGRYGNEARATVQAIEARDENGVDSLREKRGVEHAISDDTLMSVNPPPYLSIIVPAYNEAQTIVRTLGSMRQFLEEKHFAYEVIVVADGTDGTKRLARDFAAIDSRSNASPRSTVTFSSPNS